MYTLKKKYGQSTLEYSMLVIIIIGVFLVMQVYIKRGIQGRFKKTTDDLMSGSKGRTGASFYYDPRYSKTAVVDDVDCTSTTAVRAVGIGSADAYTERRDTGDCSQAKSGSTATAGFNPAAFGPPTSF